MSETTPPNPMNDLTRLLNSIQLGDTTASSDLQRLVYEELRKLAAQKMARESPDS